MPSRVLWRVLFLAVTAGALTMECWAAWDGNPETDPWTDMIVRYVPAELTLAVIGALVAWVPVHFFVRYRRKRARDSVT